MRIVLDTNVLVSGLLGVYTYPARMMDMVVLGRLKCVYDDRIMMEYREVLSRRNSDRLFQTGSEGTSWDT